MRRHLKKPTATPAKKAKAHNQMSPSDVNDIINSVISTAAPTMPKKRKTTIVISEDESSGVEIIEGPHPSPKKKVKGAAPLPASGASKELPAVSLPDDIEEIIRSSTAVESETSGRPIRSRAKTQKGAILEEIKASRMARSKPAVASESTASDDVQKLPSATEVPAMPTGSVISPLLQALNVVDTSPSKGKKGSARLLKAKLPAAESGDAEMVSPRDKAAKKKELKLMAESDDDLPQVSDLLLSTPKKKRAPEPNPMVDLEADDSGIESAPSEHESDRYLAMDDDGSVGHQSDSAPDGNTSDQVLSDDEGKESNAPGDQPSNDNPNDSDEVTSAKFQDPSLLQFYEHLPYLDKLRPILPYKQPTPQTSTPKPTSARIMFSNIARTLNPSEAKALLQGLLFTQSGFYVNFSRIHPKLLQHDSSRIRMAQSDNALAIGLYTGLCTHGMILDTDIVGPPQNQYPVHGVSVAGSDQETRRYMALIGAVLGYTSVTGNVTENGLSFYTRGEGRNGNFGNFGTPAAAPTQATSMAGISSLLSSVPMPGPVAAARGFPASRSYDDRIPVYDGRASSGRQFSFTDADFNNLSSWPLYRGGSPAEIEPGTIISVGHTVGIYKERYLSTNIHFVIILGKAAITL